MNIRTKRILTASIALLLSQSARAADDFIKAQPITLSAAVGTDQSDFFITTSNTGGPTFASDYVVFNGVVPLKGGKRELRPFFKEQIHNPNNGTFFTKNKLIPLGALNVPAGTVFQNHVHDTQSNNASIVRDLFIVPGSGVCVCKSGGGPVLLHPGTAAFPITGAAFRAPGESVANGFRVVFGGFSTAHGFEPYQSRGSALYTGLVKDIVPGKTSSNPMQFTTFGGEVYFIANNPADGTTPGQPDIFRTTEATPTTLKAVTVTTNGILGANPTNLTGSGAGLFYTAGQNNALYGTADGANFGAVVDQFGTGFSNAYDLTPSIDPQAGDFGFAAFDASAGFSRFAVYSSFNTTAHFTELTNYMSVTVSNPQKVVSTGNYYYFSAYRTISGNTTGPFLFRNFTGSSDVETVNSASEGVPDGVQITNIGEIVDVPSGSSGLLFFTGDATISGNLKTGILFAIQPDIGGSQGGNAIATPVLTENNAYVTGAHNLCAVSDSTVFRLYFSAPVGPNDNSSADSDGKEHGNKPWAVTTP